MTHQTDRLNAALADRYRIERELGAGGMATVYLAEDLKHDRKVAIKVLKPELAAVLGAERFVVEIKTTAAMSHPHILPLFDSGTADGFLFYVMPYIQGETIREKLNRETQFGVDEAVRVAREVADALDYAHRHGVIHRDIKPENILLHDGRAMVMDFGIALAVSAAAGGRMTETGLSLGTPHYMSPEQATAEKEITGRSDVYSLASVLYEMLAGVPPHEGGSAQQVIMRIIAEVPRPVTALRRTVPANVEAAVMRALEKLPADRFESARAFSTALSDPHFVAGATTARADVIADRPRRLVTGALAAALGVMTALAAWALWRPATPPPVYRHSLLLSDEQQPDPFGAVAVSRDGSRIVYVGRSPRQRTFTQLWYRSRDALEAVVVLGTDGATGVAISPDGTEIAAIQRNLIRRLPIEGGTGVQVVDDAAGGGQSVAWLDDQSLVYVSAGQKQLKRVPARGGPATVVWKSDSLILYTVTPLPGARGVLFQGCQKACSDASLWVLDLDTGSAKTLRHDGWGGYYIAPGYLAYVSEDDHSLLVAAFDPKSLEIRGTPVVVLDSITMRGVTPYLAISLSGTLVMVRATETQNGEFELVWVDRSGRESAVDTTFTFRVTQVAGNYGMALSPDETRLAIGRNTPDGDDIWIKSLPSGPATRLTFNPESESRPRWTADGRALTFVSLTGFYLRRADGAGGDSLLWRGVPDEGALSPDGQWLVIRAGSMGPVAGGRDIFGIRRGSDVSAPLVASEFDEAAFTISPNGRWIAYQSSETGRPEVFVRPFPNTGDAKVQISSDGGQAPLWSRDGSELFYLRADSTMMAIPVLNGREWRGGEPRALFKLSNAIARLEPEYYTPWEVARDGRFLFARIVRGEDIRRSPLIVVENWIEEVKAKVPR